MRLYTWRRARLADEVGSDAIPDASGGEGGHGAAKPDGVIHRCHINLEARQIPSNKSGERSEIGA